MNIDPVNEDFSQELTTDDLKALTNAPHLDEPLVSPDAFGAEMEIHSARPLWQKPWSKLMLIGLILVPVFGLAGLFLLGSGGSESGYPQMATADTEEQPESESVTAAAIAPIAVENADLKAKAALDDQSYLLAHQGQSQRESPSPSALPSPPQASSSPAITPRSSPAATPVITQRPASPVTYSTPAPARPTQSVPPAPIRPDIDRTPTPSVADPVEQWQQLAQLGSYGAIASREPESSEPVSSQRSPRTLQEPEVADIPIARSATTSGISSTARWNPSPSYANRPIPRPVLSSEHSSPDPTTLITQELSADTSQSLQSSDEPDADGIAETARTDPQPTAATTPLTQAASEDAPELSTSATDPPAILAEAEAAILDAPIESVPSIQSLIAGASAPGELKTPVILDTLNQDNRSIVVMSEALRDSRGEIAIPEGSELMVRVDHFSESGLVELSAVQAVWEEEGLLREIILPNGVLQVRGENGEPLIAEYYGDYGDQIAGMDAGQFLLGAIRNSAELYTRSNTRVQTGDGTTVVTEENPEPNLLAGALEGGTDAMLDTISDRNQRAIERMEELPKIPYIEAGRLVQVFTNQSMQLQM